MKKNGPIEKRKGRTSEGTSYNVSAHNYMFAGEMETARNRYAKSIECIQS